ncbi:hypothetical protein AYI68_g8149 [Smittium mucronatum]|uniref:Uncharacterized protein n=1 Tax=Smittium mucronatum TaxID=133383 RepID=A0A1R0GLP3_9FUNG|nr:hypothetical protein AYI68_g8149 [Smittium mucronatum]
MSERIGAEDGFYPQIGSDPLHGGRLTNISNQSDRFVDFGLDWTDSSFTHAKGLASVRRFVSRSYKQSRMPF